MKEGGKVKEERKIEDRRDRENKGEVIIEENGREEEWLKLKQRIE